MSEDAQSEQPLVSYCRSLVGVTEDVKWENNLVFSVGKKMFAVFGLPELRSMSCKVEPELFAALTQTEGVRPAPYLARHHWIALDDSSVLPREMVLELLRESHRLVAAKLSKTMRRRLGLEDG